MSTRIIQINGNNYIKTHAIGVKLERKKKLRRLAMATDVTDSPSETNIGGEGGRGRGGDTPVRC